MYRPKGMRKLADNADLAVQTSASRLTFYEMEGMTAGVEHESAEASPVTSQDTDKDLSCFGLQPARIVVRMLASVKGHPGTRLTSDTHCPSLLYTSW